MPTPIAHSLAGIAIHYFRSAGERRHDWRLLLWFVAVANLPDIDFLPGILIGRPRAYHWGPTHSVFAAFVVGGAIGFFLARRSGRYASTITLMIAAYLSHVLMDLMLGDGSQLVGLQALWPFSRNTYLLTWAVFLMAPASIKIGPVAAMIDPEILPVIARELLVMLPVVVGSWAVARLRMDS
jgi:membrane-bound metal-dependent hydrolase YbcI (DUF457 family)